MKMVDCLQDYFYIELGRITAPGRLLAQSGCLLLLAGAIGRVATGAINILPALAKQPESTESLSDIYSTLPLWWVPETWLGAAVSVLLILAGICIALHGNNVDRDIAPVFPVTV
jgi:hypothetical protein